MSTIRLIFILAVTVLCAVLVGFNLSNTCTIWFFHEFRDIPTIIVVVIALLVGIVLMLPFVFGRRSAEHKLAKFQKKVEKDLKQKEKKLAKTEQKVAQAVEQSVAAVDEKVAEVKKNLSEVDEPENKFPLFNKTDKTKKTKTDRTKAEKTRTEKTKSDRTSSKTKSEKTVSKE